MAIQEQIEKLWASLLKLGARRLIALGVIGVSVFAMTGLAGYFLSRPASEVLYAGLDRQDVGRIAGALKELISRLT
jgi:flagellar M-ring protein FliF